MENINWICKSNTVNNTVVWMCHPKVKEHFESVGYPGSLEGATKFPAAVDITLGPANYGPSADFCKDTTGFTKLGEWNMRFDNRPELQNTRLNNGDFWGIPKSTADNGDWSGANFMNGGAWGNFVGLTTVDATGKNTQADFLEVQYYQEFNPKWNVLIRNKSNQNSYYLMTRVQIASFKYIANSESEQYLIFRDGYPTVGDPTLDYANLNIPMEVSFNGQSGGAPIDNSTYEVFIKPFVRATYPFSSEESISTYPSLSSDLNNKLFLWFDASDLNGDGTNNFNDNDSVLYWKDKSKNQIKMIRMPLSGDINDGNIINNGKDGDAGAGGARARLPRIKTNFKNGLSVVRLNGTNGFIPMINNDDNTKKFMEAHGNHNNPPIPNYTIVFVHYLTEYGNGSNQLFSLGPWGAWGSSSVTFEFLNHTGLGSPTFSIRNDPSIAVYPGNLLNKWAITTVTKNDVMQTYINGTLLKPGRMHGPPFDSNNGIIKGTYWLSIGQKNGGPFGGGGTGGFQGDVAEIMLFNNPLSDDERQKVEGYLALKWNLVSLLPKSNPYTIDTSHSVQLFTDKNFGGNNNYFTIGKFSNSQLLNIGPNTLQSIKVPTGMQVILYQNGDFTGYSKSITADTPDLSNITDNNNSSFNWSKSMQSLIVQVLIPFPTDLTGKNLNVALINPDPTSFISRVPGAKIASIDGSNILFVDPTDSNNIYWYDSSDLIIKPPFNPKLISGLQNWYDAFDPFRSGKAPKVGTSIQKWLDKNDKLNDATATSSYGSIPTFQDDGKPYIDFKDTFYNIKNPWTWMSGSYYTVFIVAGTGVGRDGNRYVILLGGGNDGRYMIGQNADWFRMPSQNFSEKRISERDKNIILNNQAGVTPEIYVINYRDDNNIYIRLSGSQVKMSNGSNLIHQQSLSARTNDPITAIGTKGSGDWVRYTGRYREILTYKGSMSDRDIQTVEGYLAWKWGVNTTLPNSHPYFGQSP